MLGLGLCLALVMCLAVPNRVHAQSLYGTITGNVTDPSGATVPGAEITLTNPDTNYTQTAISNDAGGYTLKNVPDGSYRMSVSLEGFKEYVLEGVPVSVGGVTRQDVQLSVGELSDTVTVSSAATVLQTDSTDVSDQLEKAEIADLPMAQFRNYQSLVNLVPGATPARFQNAITDTPGRSLSTNVNGTARNNNNTRIDGAMSVNIWLPHHAAYVPPSETIEVVNVVTNNFDAEQGFAGGAALTVVTKSGTNEFHGSGFWYHENSSLNARNFFRFTDTDGDGEANKVKGRRHIWGGTVGGPVLKDKVFFFAGFEATQQATAKTQTSTLPTADQRAGDFSAFLPDGSGNCPAGGGCTIIYNPFTGNADGTGRTPFAGNIIPEGMIASPSATMQGLLPLPNLPGLTSNFQNGGPEVMNRFNTDVKGDWNASDVVRVWGKFSWMDATVEKDTQFGPGGGGAIGGGGDGVGDTDVKVYSAGYNWTASPTFLIDGNFGYTDMDQTVIPSDFTLENFGQDVLGIPGTNSTPQQEQACVVDGVNRCGGQPRFSVSGFSNFGQPDGWSPIFRDENSLTFTNNFSISKGSHEFRFGYDLVKHMLNHWQPEIGAGPRGRFNFNREMTGVPGGSVSDQNAWASYLLGIPSFNGKSLQWELMTTNEWQHAFYFRDRWQATPNLTFTLGLRWEYYPLVTRDDRPMEYLDLNGPRTPCGTDSPSGECLTLILDNDIGVSKKLFAPRVGLAYRLGDNSVFRAGYGITYSPIPFGRPLRGFYPLTVAGEFTAQNSSVPFTSLSEGIPIFTGPASTAPGSEIPLPSFVDQRTMPANHITRGYIQSWNVVFERKLPAEFVINLGYVGTQTTNQLADYQMNWAPPGGGNTGRQLSDVSTTNVRFWDGWLSSNYHALQVSMNRRFVDGFFVKAAYTYSRAINATDDEGWAGVSWNDPALLGRNRAQTGFNRPHMLQMAAVYELPWGKDSDGIVDRIIKDWQINGIFSANEQTPGTVGSSSVLDARSNAQTADQVGEVVNLGGIGSGNPYYSTSSFAPVSRVPGTDCTNLDCYGNSGRNIIRGTTWVNLDFSIFRNFRIKDDQGIEFRAEFFNLTNTPHFNNPNFSASSSSFMQITSTSQNALNRVIRFGLKYTF